jgi:hypothetical protein
MPQLIEIEEKKTNTPEPNPLAAMIFFFIVTSVYCIISIFLGGDTMQKIIMKVCYILFVVIGQYFINLNLSESMCGIRQWKTTLFITILPWTIIFGVLHLFLTIFPGWLSPFSNTFGYLVAKLMGLPDLINKILVPITGDEASAALISVSTDSSLLINQFSPEPFTEKKDAAGVKIMYEGKPITEQKKFDDAWEKLQLGKIIKQDEDLKIIMKNADAKKELYKFVDMKYIISEYVWNILTGFLVTSISYNYILNTGCAKSPKEMQERYDAYEEEQEISARKKKEDINNQPDYKTP